MIQKLLRFKTYPLEAVLPYVLMTYKKQIRKPPFVKDYDGKLVNMTSLRYQCFVLSGTKCVSCELEGKYFALEQHREQTENQSEAWHFNLYGVNEKGEEILFTKDHTKARSQGGTDAMSNLATMCTCCNFEKAKTER